LDLRCSLDLTTRYRSKAQIARVASEAWCADQMYCPACKSDSLIPTRNNTAAVDFTCPKCTQPYQLKSTKALLKNRIVDASYSAMVRAIRNDQTPNLFLIQYSPSWTIINLTLIPRFFFTESAIEKRKPLSATARRAGWVGCDILLNKIAADGRIPVVTNGIALSPPQVRQRYEHVRPLGTLGVKVRGWTLDVLDVVRKIGKRQISLSDVYELEGPLQDAHPENKNVRAKVRQQLQVLRDLGFLEFEGHGQYRLLG
jgi:type II restriction enzyme